MVEWRDYITIESLTLIVAIATFIVTTCAYIYTRKSDKRRIKAEIRRKQAIIDSMEDRFAMMGVDHTVADSMRMQKMMLHAEIEQLKKEL